MDNTVIVALISVGIPAITTIFNVVYTNRKAKKNRMTAEEQAEWDKRDELRKNVADGVQSLLRTEIIRAHDKYMAQKFCPIYAKEALTRQYNAYHNLGGNDVATELYKQMMYLPDKPREENNDEN